MPLGIHLRHLQRDDARGAVVSVLQVDLDFGVAVLALRMERGLGAARAASAAKAAPEKRLEEIAVVFRTGAIGTGARGFETRVPVGRRAEILPGLVVGSEPVVGRTLFRVAQHLVGLADLLELLLGVVLLADVRRVFARQPPLCALYVERGFTAHGAGFHRQPVAGGDGAAGAVGCAPALGTTDRPARESLGLSRRSARAVEPLLSRGGSLAARLDPFRAGYPDATQATGCAGRGSQGTQESC